MAASALPNIAILHYTAPPVVGGVEAVIHAHLKVLAEAGYPTTIIAGSGEASALPGDVATDVGSILIPEIDSQHPQILELSAKLEQGQVPAGFPNMVHRLCGELTPILGGVDTLVVHNILTKHFNLALTAALNHLLEQGLIGHCIAWCHDFTWTSPSSRSKVHSGQPWDLLRTPLPGVTYVVVSKHRQRELAELLSCPPEQIQVIYNGVDPETLLGLSREGADLVERLGLLACDLVLLMPVRVTRAKNIEYALEVVAALKAKGTRVKLILTGPPDPHDAESMAYFHSLLRLRKALGVEEEIRFVFESGPEPGQPLTIGAQTVGDLFRVSDLMFMPSHREGFGMPILEAGLVGLPVVGTGVPAALEIGGRDVVLFETTEQPTTVAERIMGWARSDAVHRLRRRTRQAFTWQAIFERDIRPLLRQRPI